MLVKQILMEIPIENTNETKLVYSQACLEASQSMKHRSLVIKTPTLPQTLLVLVEERKTYKHMPFELIFTKPWH